MVGLGGTKVARIRGVEVEAGSPLGLDGLPFIAGELKDNFVEISALGLRKVGAGVWGVAGAPLASAKELPVPLITRRLLVSAFVLSVMEADVEWSKIRRSGVARDGPNAGDRYRSRERTLALPPPSHL